MSGCLVGEGDLGVGEADGGRTVEVLALGKGAGDATEVGAPLAPVRGAEVVLGHDAVEGSPERLVDLDTGLSAARAS